MRRTPRTFLSAVTVMVAAFGLAGCSGAPEPVATTTTAATTTTPATAPAAPLPPPEALTEVLYRLADMNLPGPEKVGLVQFATADDAAELDKFGRALHDGGFRPPTFEAADLAWSQSDPGNVVASVTVSTADDSVGDFTFPLEFNPHHGRWQLTQTSAELLLETGSPATPTR